MTSLHVRDVPEPVVAALRERAARNGRSMQRELQQILQVAAQEPAPQTVRAPVQLRTVRVGGPSTWSRDEIYDDTGR